ncbi:hypothetical protein MWU38_00945 [Qipengyuania sp. S6317L1]|uniref:hypothetical protein n=1 Tax=Qipengyuania sp. S6317L1 TaxID=2926410 RepID=UPI001FF2C93B|nr:hypothetical protein [Qipengyuania sp. S6317L1]MCK0097936.1 hypothetical protein [Qipengyuania sp. S6317L1]
MADTTSESDRIMHAASQSLDANRHGGVHRRAASIGKGSANAKLKTWAKRGGYFALAVFAIMTAASIIGVVLNGIGFVGVMAVAMAIMCAAVFFSQFPKVKIPKRSELKQGNPKQMVARVELWLESQRASLPPMAAALVEKMGGQLDALGAQLETMDEAHPAMSEVRELVGDYIPETIDNYRKIPEHLRSEEHAGGTADARLIESLTKISGELDRVTRRLAEGAMDDLAVKSRYLDYRFGSDDLLQDASGMPDTGVPLPDFAPATKELKS